MKVDLRNIRYSFIAGLALLYASAMQSCSEETYPDSFNQDAGEGAAGGKRYFSMQLLTSDAESIEASEGQDFTFGDGTAFEHAMDVSGDSDNVVILFNDDWTFYGYTCIDYDRMYSQGSGGTSYPSEISYIGVIHSPEPEVLYSMPQYGLIVLNAYDLTTALGRLTEKPGATIDDVLALLDSAEGKRRPGMSGNGYFTMTSTAFLEADNGGWKHSALFTLDKSKIYDNRMQATYTPAATAIVERMAAKFSLSLPGSVGGNSLNFRPDNGRAQVIVCHYTDGQPNYNNRNWTCSVDAWGINKYETSSFYFRNIIGDGADITSYPYTYGADINTTNRPFYNGWNRSSYKRALWGIDPHYKEGVYPRQYRPAVDNPDLEYYGFKGTVPSLGYVSYNDLSTNFSGLGKTEGVNVYSSENTFPDTRIGALWQHDLGASQVVIGARIHLSGVDETKADYDLFRNRIGIFYPSVTDFASYFITTVNNQLTSQSTMTYRHYNWSDPANNETQEMRTFKVDNSNYKLYYGNEPLTPEKMASMTKWAIPATIENGDGKVIPWIEGMYIGRRNIDPNTYEEVGEIQRLSIATDDFKSLIYDWVGSFDHFNGGRMVYSVPIRHNASQEKVSSSIYRPTVGDYGVARNTWYSFAVEAIDNLGNPVDDPNQPIIPYETSLENSILMEIKVIDWHEFSTEVTLPGSVK